MTSDLATCQLASKDPNRRTTSGSKDKLPALNRLPKTLHEKAISVTLTCFRIVNITIGHNKEVKAKLQMKSFSETFSLTDIRST